MAIIMDEETSPLALLICTSNNNSPAGLSIKVTSSNFKLVRTILPETYPPKEDLRSRVYLSTQ